jgi:hypothetical protein
VNYRKRFRSWHRELQEAIQKLARAPLFVFTKYPEPYPTLNPSIQLVVRPLGRLAGSASVSLLNMAVGPMQKAFQDFAFVQPPQEVQVSGFPAAHMRARYTMKNADGEEFNVLSRMWIVMSGPQEGPDVSERELRLR